MARYNDLTGQHFGRWTVLNITEKRTKNRNIIWHCQCECGNEKDVDGYTLRSGQSKSCGCLNKEKAAERCRQTRINLTGQRFGKLVALYPIYSGSKYQHTQWHCKCDCGNECDIDMGNLRSGKSQSCGCTISKQEEKIIKLLTQYQIPFIYQYQFSNLPNKKFDFYINNKYILEYDGSQHFYSTETGWNTLQHLKQTRESDLKKNKYCFEHNIPLIRIPYDTEYTFEDLKLETTRFLLTPNNEEEYYNARKNRLTQEEMNRISNYINKQKGQSYPCSNQIVICGIITHTQEQAIDYMNAYPEYQLICQSHSQLIWINQMTNQRWIWVRPNVNTKGYRFYKVKISSMIEKNEFYERILPCCALYCCSMEFI